jgi:hypothetical protein
VSNQPRTRRYLIGAGLLALVVIAAAFALGGHPSTPDSAGSSSELSPSRLALPQPGLPAGTVQHGVAATTTRGATDSATTTTVAAGTGVTATRVVKTGNLALTVPRGQVPPTITKLVTLTTQLGGYISQSRTDNVAGSPTGELTMRIPVAKFELAVSDAEKLGHETALSTDAHDVTGKYVDLTARAAALRRTRQTYLTILSKATTIGQTLSVQQRVEDVQQQIEQLQGQLKVLRNQSSDGTLTVDVTQAGAPVTPSHHHRGGIGGAWHTSVSRFTRGVDVIVSILGPLLLALILLGLAALVVRLGLRRTRRATT